MEDTQHDDVAVRKLITNFIFRDENAPNLPRPEAWKPLAEARLRRYALDAVEDRTHGPSSRRWIDRLEEVIETTQVRKGRFGPAERHKSAP